MGVMLRPDEDPMPSEEELARLAGLVPGDIDRKKLEILTFRNSELIPQSLFFVYFVSFVVPTTN